MRRIFQSSRWRHADGDAELTVEDLSVATGVHMYAVELLADDTWRTLVTTSTMAELIGAPPAGANLDEWYDQHVHPDDQTDYDRWFSSDNVRAGGEFQHSYRLLRDDGRVLHVVERGRSRVRPDGRVVVEGSVVDITEQREAERLLGEIVDSMDVVVYRARRRPDGASADVVVTAGIEAILGGAPPETGIFDVWHERVHPGDRDRHAAAFAYAAMARLEPVSCEYRVIGYDGAERWIWERAFPQAIDGGGVVFEGFATDITERRRALARVEEVEDLLHRALENVEEVVYTAYFDEAGAPRMLFSGPGVEALLGGDLPGDGRTFWDVWQEHAHPDDRAECLPFLDALRRHEQASVVFRLHGLDGKTRWIWARGYPRPTAPGQPRVHDGVLSDVTERQQAAEELRSARDEAQRRSRIDALTGVFNRAHFVEEMGGEIARARRAGETPAVVLLDIDHFKRVNDIFLHAGGDEVLREVARRIGAAVRDYDTVARWGGEEFVVLLPGVPDDESLRRLAETIRRAVAAQPITLADDEVVVTASAGAARATMGRWTPESLVDAADRALYSAKRRGRDRLRLYGDLSEDDFQLEEPDAIRIAEAMSRSASVREDVPPFHCARVADLAAQVAAELGLGAAAVLRCRLGGWLHDIGKVAIPDRVLANPGTLDADEWRLIREHPELGSEIVGRIPGLADAAPVVRHHHERWDGSGYPDGLAGEEIPLEARIVAAVDTWCAMTEDRVFRPGLGHDEARPELLRAAGSQLDPRVVEALAAVIAVDVSPAPSR